MVERYDQWPVISGCCLTPEGRLPRFVGVVGLVQLQWLPRFKSAQDKGVRGLRAVKSACPAYTKSYIFTATYKTNV